MINNTDDFFITAVQGDRFAPRVKTGEQLIMCRGFTAEEGDVVAIGRDDADNPELAFYSEGVDYYAVAVGIMNLNNYAGRRNAGAHHEHKS